MMKIEFNNQIKPWRFLGFSIIALLLFLVYIDFDKPGVVIVIVALSFFILPGLFLHVEYFLQNKNEVIEITENGINYQKRDGSILKYNLIDIQKIVLYKSSATDMGNLPFSPIEYYFYAKIILKQNLGVIIITSLMVNDIMQELQKLKGIPIERKRAIFASLRYPIILPNL